ncbi:hypothetical protein Tco_0418491 [Tanacetum coccineum]
MLRLRKSTGNDPPDPWISTYSRERGALLLCCNRIIQVDMVPTYRIRGWELAGVDAHLTEVWICQISQEISQKRTRERMSDQEAKEIKAEARKIMPQPSTVNCKKPQSKPKPHSIVSINMRAEYAIYPKLFTTENIKERERMYGQDEEKKDREEDGLLPTWNWMAAMVTRGLELLDSIRTSLGTTPWGYWLNYRWSGSASYCFSTRRIGDLGKIGYDHALASKGNIPDVRKVNIYFCKPGGLGKQKNLSFIMLVKTRKLQSMSCERDCDAENGLRKTSIYGLINLPHTLRSDRVVYSRGGMAREGYKSHTHLKVFGCDSFVKVKDVCGEAMKCTFLGSGLDDVRYSFRDTKSHQNDNIVAKHGLSSKITLCPGGSSDTSEGSENSRSFEDSGRSDEEDSEDGAFSEEGGSETPQVRRSTRESRAPVRYSPSTNYLLLIENGEPESYSEALSSKESVKWKKAIIEEMVKEEQDGRKSYKVRLVVKGFQQKRGQGFLASWAGRKPRVQIEGNFVRTDSSTKATMKDRCSEKHVLGYVLTVGVTTVEWESRLQKSITIDVHRVGDEREVKALCSFNWPPRELITEDGVLPESLARGVQFSTRHAVWHDRVVWHEPEQFSSELNNISLWFDPVDCHDYPSRGYHVISCVDLHSAFTFRKPCLYSLFVQAVCAGAIYRTKVCTEVCAGVIYPNSALIPSALIPNDLIPSDLIPNYLLPNVCILT